MPHFENDYWPRPLRHCGRPLVASVNEEITIGEISGEAVDGFAGNRMLFTALVPLDEVVGVLKTVGGLGHGVDLAPEGSDSSQDRERLFPVFSVHGPGDSRHFESLVHTWRNHNRTVILPDDAFLMRYRLVPRVLNDGMSWDDLSGPVYDVVRVTPVSIYSAPSEHTTARIVVRRDYLEDYLSLKGCAAIATFWDERFSLNDPDVAALIGGDGSKFEQPGREMWFMRTRLPAVNQVSQVWACALLLAPGGRPISDPPELELTWPDRKTPIRGVGRQVSFAPFESVYVSDEVLMKYEKQSEFLIAPEDGFVSYDGWWAVSYCQRSGRNCIELELRKMYEGLPVDVIRHYNKFALQGVVAERDNQLNGTRHVGIRARELIQAFLQLTSTITRLCDAVGLSFTQEDVGNLSTEEIRYKGWWTFESLKPLGYVIPMTIAFPDFLSRCTELFKLFENLRPAALRQVVIRLGLSKETTKAMASLKLLASICQLASICAESGLDLVAESNQACSKWDAARKLPEFERLFALNVLRTIDSHSASLTAPDVTRSLEVFGIRERNYRSGWGKALDEIYDQTISSLRDIESLIASALT